MGVQEVVHVVGELIGDGEEQMAQRHGPEAVSAAQGARALLADRLREDLDDDSLWSDFESDPRGTAAELTGTLEALVEADPSLAEELDAFMQEYYQAVGPPGARLEDAPPEDILADDRDVPEEAQMDPADEDVGQGEYLYGNLEPGSVSVGERVEAPEVEPEPSMEAAGVAPPFEDLYAAIETHPDVDPEARTVLENALRGTLDESARGIEANEERLLYHLLTIKRLNGDILEIVLTRLLERDDVPQPVGQAVMKARETSE